MLSVLDADCATYSHSFVHLRSILTPFADKIGISESVRMGGGADTPSQAFWGSTDRAAGSGLPNDKVLSSRDTTKELGFWEPG